VLGPDLVDLNISFRSELNIQDLLSCPKLESLTLWGDDLHILNPAEKDPLLSPATFLPQLRKLDCRICLGVWSYLFEWKPNLVRLSLSCCHIGCRVEESRNLPSKRLKSASEVYKVQNYCFYTVIITKLYCLLTGLHKGIRVEPDSSNVATTGILGNQIVRWTNNGYDRQSRPTVPQTEEYFITLQIEVQRASTIERCQESTFTPKTSNPTILLFVEFRENMSLYR